MIDYTALGGDHFRMRKRNMHGICSHAIRETVSPSLTNSPNSPQLPAIVKPLNNSTFYEVVNWL